MLNKRMGRLICIELLVLLYVFIGEASNSDKRVPMSMWMKMKDMRSTSEFVHTMVRPSMDSSLKASEKEMFKTTETGSTQLDPHGVENMANVVATPDVCDPRATSVEIPPSDDPRVIYWPTCTRVERCGGCCGLDLLECAPTSTDTVDVWVMKMYMSGESHDQYDWKGNVKIPLERHLACECRCRTKASDCKPGLQYYDSQSCRCLCHNENQASSCQGSKRWDPNTCGCVCTNLMHCLTDEVFDFNTCSCQPNTGSGGLSMQSNPCSYLNCRANYQPEMRNGRCQCRPRRG